MQCASPRLTLLGERPCPRAVRLEDAHTILDKNPEDPLCSPAQVEAKLVGRVRKGVRYGAGLPQVKSGWARSGFKEEAKKAGTVVCQAMLLRGGGGASGGWSRGCRAQGCPGLGAFSFKENKEDDGVRVIQG